MKQIRQQSDFLPTKDEAKTYSAHVGQSYSQVHIPLNELLHHSGQAIMQ